MEVKKHEIGDVYARDEPAAEEPGSESDYLHIRVDDLVRNVQESSRKVENLAQLVDTAAERCLDTEKAIDRLCGVCQSLLNESLARRTTIQEVVTKDADSVTLGTPGNGQIKVYGDLANPEAFRVKIDRALDMMAHAQANRPRNGY